MTHSGHIISIPRRTIDELIARYELAPELRDLFVEGPRDRGFYSWCLEKLGYKQVTVFEIDAVDIPREVLAFHGLRSGNRSRVIALALELDEQFSLLEHVRCIADSDFDFIFAFRTFANHLLYTDYSSMDLYSLNDEILEKVLRLGFNIPKADVQILIESMIPILEDLFVVRAANQKLNWGMALTPFTRCCNVNGSVVTCDVDDFITRCLDSNQRRNERGSFDDVYSELRSVYLTDPRQRIHGHDYFELVGWYLNQRRGWAGYRRGERSIMENVMGALDDRLLFTENLFLQLDDVFR